MDDDHMYHFVDVARYDISLLIPFHSNTDMHFPR